MKTTISTLILVLLCLGLNSCKKDEIPPVLTEKTIEGSWEVTKIRVSACTDVEFPNTQIDVEQGECFDDGTDQVCLQANYRFTSTGTFNYSVELIENGGSPNYDVVEGTYTYAGNIIELCLDDGTCRTGTASVSGNKLNMQHTNFSFDCQYAFEAKRL